ncbi:MAG: pantoate--beta-alanine ligase [Bacteroidales bacterium]|nr:pantoate--beta-alanine ligase [Bacteroidales bacterium]
MKIIGTVSELKQAVAAARKASKTVGLVPTMGALHKGHLSLVKRATEENGFVVVSVFVNPTQFNNPEDLRTYPRTLEADVKLVESNTTADVVFAPSVEEMYPSKDTRMFDLSGVGEVMEGKMRPGHFNGVCQVVSKLFAFVTPDKAYFGEKDFQQIAVIRKMVRDCDFQIEIVDCPIVREDDGLAVSSRNVLLTPEHRAVAPRIHRVLAESTGKVKEMRPMELTKWVVSEVDAEPLLKVEYYEIVDGLSMQRIDSWEETDYAVGCITVQAGNVRLIDNIIYKKG